MSYRIFVGNLSFHTTEEDVQDAFAAHGTVSEVKLILDRDTGDSRGFAFVNMSSAEEGRKAIAGLDGAMLDGRPLRVNEAEERSRGGGGRDNRW